MNMILSKLLIIWTFKDENLADNWTNLAENLGDKVKPRGVGGVCYFQLWGSKDISYTKIECPGVTQNMNNLIKNVWPLVVNPI